MYIQQDYSNTIIDTFQHINKIEFFHNGHISELSKNKPEFETTLQQLTLTFEQGRVDPAFGVSLHEETQKELLSGDWIKLTFDSQQEKNGLPFTALLFRADNVHGLNLIREYEGKYNGRCIFIHFMEETPLSALMKKD